MDMTKEEKANYDKNPNIMLTVGGNPFRCECGCNVFGHPTLDKDTYQCNSCDAEFTTT